MKTIISLVTVLTTISLSSAAQAENIAHISQLLSTKDCSLCDLSNAGLVMSNLSGSQLRGADLSGANLSRANLRGADLSGANLSGASLNGADLSGANLSGANLNGTDLRSAYLVNANLTDVSLDTAYMQGAIGVPNYAGTPAQFHNWGALEAQKGNYQAAIGHYNSALNIKPDFAPAYLARGLARYRLGDAAGATQDAEIAAHLFENENDPSGYQASQAFLQRLELATNPPKGQGGGIDRFIGGFSSLLLKLFF